jgi:hypothetical protein
MNQIDKLFSEKLAEHASTPSKRANELFLSRLEKNTKKTVFWTSSKRYFAAAASVVLVAGIGYFANTNSSTKPGLAANAPAVERVSAPAVVAPEKIQSNSTENQLAENNTNISAKTFKINSLAPTFLQKENTAALDSKQELKDDKLRSFTLDESLDYLNPEQKITMTRPDTKSLEPVFEQTSDELKTNDDTFIIISPMTEAYVSVDMMDIPSILDQPSLDNALIVEDHEERLLTKIFEDVKHLKKGQHLDLSKFGFKSLDELAMNDEGFIVTEARKIKSKLQWIKSKINN